MKIFVKDIFLIEKILMKDFKIALEKVEFEILYFVLMKFPVTFKKNSFDSQANAFYIQLFKIPPTNALPLFRFTPITHALNLPQAMTTKSVSCSCTER